MSLPLIRLGSSAAQNNDIQVEYEPLATTEDATQEESSEMRSKEIFTNSEGRPYDELAQAVTFLALAILLTPTWIIALWDPSSYSWFTWHPLMQTLGVALFTYGIMTLQPTARPKTKAAGLTRHQLAMFILGFPAILIGTSAVAYNKYLGGRPHFTSWHGCFGIMTVTAMVLQILLGAGSVWFNGKLFGGNPKAKLVWKYHRLCGYIVYPMFILTIYTGGAWSQWAAEHSSFIVRFLAYSIAPFVMYLGVIARVRLSKMQFF